MNTETLKPIKAELKESHGIDSMTIRRFGAEASRRAVSLTEIFEEIDKKELKRKVDGELFTVSPNTNKELSSENFDGNTGIAIVAEGKKGERYVYLQENSEKGLENFSEKLYSGIPEDAVLKQAVILTPEGQNGNFSKNDRLLDHLSLVIDHYSLLRTGAKDSLVQVITYPKDQDPGDYKETKFNVKCLKDGSTEIYHDHELVEHGDMA